MAAKQKLFNATKRFGARYGRSLKRKFVAIEAEKNKRHTCPSCAKDRVKRLAVGIWQCGKCGVTFAGKAYTVSKKIIVTEAVTKEEMVVPEFIEEFEKKVEPRKPRKVKETEGVQTDATAEQVEAEPVGEETQAEQPTEAEEQTEAEQPADSEVEA